MIQAHAIPTPPQENGQVQDRARTTTSVIPSQQDMGISMAKELWHHGTDRTERTGKTHSHRLPA